MELHQGDNPEFYQDGIDNKMTAGNTRSAFNFPALFRQQSALFAKDDRFSSFKIVGAKVVQDSIWFDYEIQTKLGDLFPESQKV